MFLPRPPQQVGNGLSLPSVLWLKAVCDSLPRLRLGFEHVSQLLPCVDQSTRPRRNREGKNKSEEGQGKRRKVKRERGMREKQASKTDKGKRRKDRDMF